VGFVLTAVVYTWPIVEHDRTAVQGQIFCRVKRQPVGLIIVCGHSHVIFSSVLRNFLMKFQTKLDSFKKYSGDTVTQFQVMELHSTSPHLPRPEVSSRREFYTSIPVPNGSRSIRLLRLLAAEKSQKNCPLVGHVYLANLVSSQSFTILSYVWGKETNPSHTITCQPQGVRLEITSSCYGALSQLREKYGALTIWVDAICINQEDNDEKTDQIRLMGELYSLAERAYVWLGYGDENSDKAMDYLKRCAKMMAHLPFEEVVAPTSRFRDGHYIGWKMYLGIFRTLKDIPGEFITFIGAVRPLRS
jgi:hypothetical protein